MVNRLTCRIEVFGPPPWSSHVYMIGPTILTYKYYSDVTLYSSLMWNNASQKCRRTASKYARRAHIENKRLRRHKPPIPVGPPNFVMYEPVPTDVPTITQPRIGLRIGPDIRIPVEEGIQEGNFDETDTQQSALWSIPCQTTPAQANQPSAKEDAEIACQVKEI